MNTNTATTTASVTIERIERNELIAMTIAAASAIAIIAIIINTIAHIAAQTISHNPFATWQGYALIAAATALSAATVSLDRAAAQR
jgi:cation transporter-like permease